MPPKPKSQLNRATNERNVYQLNQNATNISGTVEELQRQLEELELEIRTDREGIKEYEEHVKLLNKQKALAERRIELNKTWVENFESESGFESTYKKLCEEIAQVYAGAKDFHTKGIDMLIQEFNYHVMYKRHDDTFWGIPYVPL